MLKHIHLSSNLRFTMFIWSDPFYLMLFTHESPTFSTYCPTSHLHLERWTTLQHPVLSIYCTMYCTVHAKSFQIISHSRVRISLPATEISLYLDKIQHLFNCTELYCHCKRWHTWSGFYILSIRGAFLIIILRWILAVNQKAGGHVLPLSAHSRFMVLVPGLPTSRTSQMWLYWLSLQEKF